MIRLPDMELQNFQQPSRSNDIAALYDFDISTPLYLHNRYIGFLIEFHNTQQPEPASGPHLPGNSMFR